MWWGVDLYVVGVRSVYGGGSVCMWWGLGLYVVGGRYVCGGG